MITFDFESRSYISVTDVGAYRYSIHPKTQVLCAAWLFDDKPELGHWHRHTTGQGEWDPVAQTPDDDPMLVELIERIEDGEPIEAHNAFFEQCMWEFAWLSEFPWLPLPKPEQWHCSAAKAASFALPRKLEELAVVLRVSEQKDMEGHRVMLKLSKPARKTKANPDREWYEDPKDLRRNWMYNGQDVRAEHACSRQLRPLSPRERGIWLLDQRMNRRGVFCDLEMVDKAIDLAEGEVERMNVRIGQLTDGAVPKVSSRPKLKAWVNGRGVPLPDTGAPTVERFLEDELLYPDVEEVLRLCLEGNKTSTKKYVAMAQRICPDGRIRDLMMYHGASTGRWAGTGIQPHNFPRGHVKDMEGACEAILMADPLVIETLYGPVMDHLSSCTRGALCAPPGSDLIVADYSAVEARDVFWLAGDDNGLEAFRVSDAKEGQEVYCLMAEQIFGYPVDKENNPDERFVGKQTILGCGYGMGPDKYFETCLKYGVRLEMKLCEKAVYTYRDVHEPVKQMWGDQEAAAIAAVRNKGQVFTAGKCQWAVRGKFLHCKLPSDRLLSYYKPMLSSMLNFRFKVLKQGRRESWVSINASLRRGEGQAFSDAVYRLSAMCKANGWEHVSDVRPRTREQTILRFWGQDSKTKRWSVQETYGGKLVENITQATARDQLADAMVRMDEQGVYTMLLSVHDETIGEVKTGKGDLREFELEMARPEAWCADAPLVAEGWRGKRYRKA